MVRGVNTVSCSSCSFLGNVQIVRIISSKVIRMANDESVSSKDIHCICFVDLTPPSGLTDSNHFIKIKQPKSPHSFYGYADKWQSSDEIDQQFRLAREWNKVWCLHGHTYSQLDSISFPREECFGEIKLERIENIDDITWHIYQEQKIPADFMDDTHDNPGVIVQ